MHHDRPLHGECTINELSMCWGTSLNGLISNLPSTGVPFLILTCYIRVHLRTLCSHVDRLTEKSILQKGRTVGPHTPCFAWDVGGRERAVHSTAVAWQYCPPRRVTPSRSQASTGNAAESSGTGVFSCIFHVDLDA